MAFAFSMRGMCAARAACSDPGADRTQVERNSIWSVIVPADGTCAATWREGRLRRVPDLWAALGQATACPRILTWGAGYEAQ